MNPEQTEQAKAAENAVLGAALLQPSLLDQTELVGSQFFQPEFGVLFDLLIDMRRSGKPIDAQNILLAARATSLRGVPLLDAIGGSSQIAKWANDGLPAHFKFYSDQVRKWSDVRNLERHYRSALSDLDNADVDPDAVRAKTDATTTAVIWKRAVREYKFCELVEGVLNRVEGQTSLSGVVPWGMPSFDSRLGGLFPGELTVLAARPSIGKSALGFQVAIAASKIGKRVAFVSCEMTEGQLGERLIAAETTIPLSRIRMGTLTEHERDSVKTALPAIKRMLSRVWVASRPTVAEIRSRCRVAQTTGGLDFLVVDYLGLLGASNPRASLYERTTELSAEMKSLAQELHVPILLLAQLNREAGKTDEPPRLEHLRDSGAIEQDANNVLFIHRKRGSPDTEIVIAKQRQGPVGMFRMYFDEARASFIDPEAGVAWVA
jgi:replicative DNA helicase